MYILLAIVFAAGAFYYFSKAADIMKNKKDNDDKDK